MSQFTVAGMMGRKGTLDKHQSQGVYWARSILILYVCSHELLVPAEEGALRAALEVVYQEARYI